VLEWLAQAFGGTIIEAVIRALANAFRLRRLDRERDDAIAGRALAEERTKTAEAQNQIRKEMQDAQATAPSSRSDLADRLRRESVQDGEPQTGSAAHLVQFMPFMAGRFQGPQGKAG
jgi:Flp pilus assembly protein TadB